MKRILLFLLLSVSILAQNTTGNVISGKVFKNNNTVAAGATVIAFGFGPPAGDSLLFTRQTGTNGQYAFEHLPEGNYFIKATFENLTSQVAGPLIVNQNTFITNLNLYLGSSTVFNNSVAGVITNAETGAPIHNATAKLQGASGTIGYSANTDQNGAYIIRNIVPASYMFEASAPGFQTAALLSYITIHENTVLTDLSTPLQPLNNTSISFSGVVRKGGLATVVIPIPGAFIRVMKLSTTPDSVLFITHSDSVGKFRFPALPAGTYQMLVEKEGFFTKIVNNLQLFQNIDNYIITLEEQNTTNNATIKGMVTFDGTNLPVAQARIDFMPLNMPPSATNMFVYTGTDGRYQKLLPAGGYVVTCSYFSSNGVVYKEYYDNALNIADADIVSILPGQITEGISFGIPGNQTPPTVVLKGKVTDTLNNAVHSALVTLWMMNDSLRLTTYTGPDGNYHFSLTNHPALSIAYRVSAQKEGYRVQFYNHKPTFALADVIIIHGDTVVSDINFSLEKMQNTSPNSISGFVFQDDSVGTPIANAFVIASKRPTGEILFTFTGSNGAYSFANISPGGYYILFAATGFIPEFYNNAMIWEQATLIPAAGQVTGINGSLASVVSNNNPGIVAGMITTLNGDPLSEVYISIVNGDGLVIGYAFSDASGSYSVAGLAQGTYTIQASKVQYTSYSQNLEYNPDAGLTHLLNISLTSSPTDIGSDDGKIPDSFRLLGNYPNPFNPVTTVEFTVAVKSDITLKVYDLFGREIAVLSSGNYEPGRYTVRFDGSSYASGVYIYKFSYGNGQYITRKMTLLK